MTSEKVNNPQDSTNQTNQQRPQLFTDTLKRAILMVIIHWKWVVASLIICLGLGEAVIRYTRTVFNVSEKVLIKDNDSYQNGNALKSMTMGQVSMSNGFDNELEILSTHTLATQTVRELGLYVSYYSVGRFKKTPLYKNQPVSVGIRIEMPRRSQVHLPLMWSIKTVNTISRDPMSIRRLRACL